MKTVEEAVKNPKSTSGKKVFHDFHNILRSVGAKTPFSSSERSNAISELFAMTQFFGVPTLFMTISLDDTHTILALRMSFRSKSNSNEFPQVDYGFIKALQDGDCDFKETISIDNNNLIKLMNSNPVSAASFFQKTLDAFFEHALGINLNHSTKRTIPLSSRKKGIFGFIIAAFIAIETSARKALHGHAVITSKLSGELIQKAVLFEDSLTILKEVLDQMFQNHLPDNLQFDRFTRLMTAPKERLPLIPTRFTYYTCPISSENLNGIIDRAYNINSRVGNHQHCPNCRKPPSGKFCCRSAYPKELEEETNFVQLLKYDFLTPDDHEQTNNYYQVLKENKIEKELEQHDRKITSHYENPFPVKDDRLIVYNSKRPKVNIKDYNINDISNLYEIPIMIEDNILNTDILINNHHDTSENKFKHALSRITDSFIQYYAIRMLEKANASIVQINPIATALLACNTNMVLLGAIEDAKATIFYIIKYITKDSTELASSLSVIKYALDKQKLYPSKAINSNEDLKNGKYLLSIMLNKLVEMREISDTQAAALCIGFKSQASTTKTTYLFMQSAMSAVQERVIQDNNGNFKNAYDDDIL